MKCYVSAVCLCPVLGTARCLNDFAPRLFKQASAEGRLKCRLH
jgi:hypothetical protein